jgi:hypothetical protein
MMATGAEGESFPWCTGMAFSAQKAEAGRAIGQRGERVAQHAAMHTLPMLVTS